MMIGEKIKSLRRNADVTQEKLAEYLHISYQAISKWENNTAMPDISYIVPLANFFGVTTDELFDIAGRDSQKEMDEYEKRRFDLWHAGNVRGTLDSAG